MSTDPNRTTTRRNRTRTAPVTAGHSRRDLLEDYETVHHGSRDFGAPIVSHARPDAKPKKAGRAPVSKQAEFFDFTGVPDDRPAIGELNLPGPRRELEGRGGAHGALHVARTIIRSPLTAAMSSVLPARTGGRPTSYSDAFYFFFMQLARELGSLEAAEATLQDQATWREVAKEFWFELGHALSTRPIKATTYFKWRNTHLRDRLDTLLHRHTVLAAALAEAIKSAEAGPEYVSNLLNPGIWDLVAADGTVMKSASDVRAHTVNDSSGAAITFITGSRAKDHANARIGTGDVDASAKRSGARSGAMQVVATCQGRATYTRVVLAFDVADDTQADAETSETALTKRCLHRLYRTTGAQFPVLVYDGLLMPTNYHEFLRDHGVVTVNRTRGRGDAAATAATESERAADRTGWAEEVYGREKGHDEAGQPNLKRTTVTELATVTCHNGGTAHQHDLILDNGSVYEVPSLDDVRAAPRGVGVKGKVRLDVTDARVLRSRSTSQHALQLTFTGRCTVGGGTYQHTEIQQPSRMPKTISKTHQLANLRVIAEDDPIYPDVAGSRNQIESFFSWFEKRHTHKDRASAYAREDQFLDLLSAAMLANTEAWAHLLYRHPNSAQAFADRARQLAARPSTSPVVIAG